MLLRYLNFDLRIEKTADATGWRVGCQSPAGETSGSFDLDLAGSQAMRSSSSVSSRDVKYTGLSSDQAAPRAGVPAALIAEGDRLFRTLIAGSVKTLFDRCREQVSGKADLALRLRLRFDSGEPESRQLQELPWESLYCRETRLFLALSRSFSVVRFLEAPLPHAPLSVQPPLKTLLLAASPRDLPRLDLKREQRLIRQACAETTDLVVDTLDGPDALGFQRRLLRDSYHILHYMGHGELDELSGTGQLLFEGPDGESKALRSDALALRLRGPEGPRFVVLNACKTAQGSSSATGEEPFLSAAHSLVLTGVPAVVAMRRPISDPAAIGFAEKLYRGLAAGDPVDAAVTEGRLAMSERSPGTAEWTIPALFLRVDDGRLFDLTRPACQEPTPDTEVEIEDIHGEKVEVFGVIRNGPGPRGADHVRIRGVGGQRNLVVGVKDSRKPGVKDSRKSSEKETSQKDDKFSFETSFLHPRQVPKGTDSLFVLRVYLADERPERAIERDREELKAKEEVFDTDLEEGRKVDVSLESTDLTFKPAFFAMTVNQRPLTVKLTGRPVESCRPGVHPVVLTMRDSESQEIVESQHVMVSVVDYAFDHVSQPVLGHIVSGATGLASMVAYGLTLLGKIDATLGVSAGTAAATVGAVIEARMRHQYRALPGAKSSE